jgi:hypothetical protein
MAIGNMVGRTIKFEDWKGDARSGRVISILDNGDYEVSTDSGMALVSNDEIIKMRKGGYVPKSKKLTARQQAKLEKVLHEFKMGELHSGSKTGPIVKSRKQALAIGLAEARSTKMEHGGDVSKYSVDKYDLETLQNKGFTISKMNDFLMDKFPDSFGFTLYPVKDNSPSNYRQLIPDTDNYYGIKDDSLKVSFDSNHGMSYRVYQGGENTYFYFILDGSDGNGYIGSFGFKDQGDVPKEYVTSFTALLNKLYGYPFKVSHEVYARGGGVGDVKTYKLRAEGLNDFLAFLQQGMYMKIKSFTVEPIGIPDVVVTFITDSSLSEIKSKLKKVPDSHVMLETVKPINEYTGDRDGEEYAKGGSIKELSFDNSNLYFYGFGRDTNGNTVVKVGFPNQKAFSIQINNPQFRNTYSLKSNKVSEISESDLNKIEKEVVDYIKSFGSAKQKSTLKVYSGLKMAQGGSVDKELIDASAKSIYDKKGMMALRNTFLQVAQTDEKAGDKSTADYRRKVVADYQSKQPKFMAQGGSMDWKHKMEKGGGVGDKLPPAKIYGELLYKAISKFDITESEARKRYGSYTIEQWEKLLGEKVKMAQGGSMGWKHKMAKGGGVGEKIFSINPHSIGKAKYVIDYYDGKSKHNDGSPFIGIKTFSNKIKLEQEVKKLKSEGYKEVSNVFNAIK